MFEYNDEGYQNNYYNSNNSNNSNGIDIKKVLIFGGIVVIAIIILFSLLFSGHLKTIKGTLTTDKLTNKVIVLYDKDKPLDKTTEKNLKKISSELNIDIYKVQYNSSFTKLMDEQGKLYTKVQPEIKKVEDKIIANQKDTKVLAEINDLILMANAKSKRKEDNSAEIKSLVEKTKLSENEIKQYLNTKNEYSNVIFSGSVDTKTFPLILVIKNNEVGRFTIASNDKEVLKSKLISARASLLIKTNTLQNVLRYNMKQKNFVVMYSNGYDLSLTQVNDYIKTASGKFNFDYIYVDITNIGNADYYGTYMKHGYTKELNTTPIIVTYIGGKEFERVNGSVTPDNVNKLLQNFLNKTGK